MYLSKSIFLFCAGLTIAGCNTEPAVDLSAKSSETATNRVEFNHQAETPVFEDKDAEILAMQSAGELVAPFSLYERTTDDLDRIRSQYPNLSVVMASATSGYKMSEMLIGLDDNAMTLFEGGNYTQWDKLNQKFGVVSITKGSGSYVKMQFERSYNIAQLATVYMDEKMSGMTYAEPNFIMGASQDICLENLADDNRLYIFKQGQGDCPAGCITWQYAGFEVDANQVVTQLGQFSSFDATPDWYENNQTCKQFL